MGQKVNIDTKTFIRFWAVPLFIVSFFWLISKASSGLILVGVALFLAIAIKPLVNKIKKFTKNTELSASIAVLLVVLVVISAVLMVGPVMINETARFFSQLPDKMSQMESSLSGLNQFGQTIGIDNFTNQITDGVGKFAQSAMQNLGSIFFTSVGALANIIASSILVIVLTLLFLLQGPTLIKELWEKVANKDNEKSLLARRITEKIAEVISKYVFGQVTVAIIDGLVVGIAVLILSLIFNFQTGLALPMSVIAFVFYLIPMFGPIISWFIITLLIGFSSLGAGLAFATFYIIYSQIENNVLAPKIQGEAMKLPSLAILVAVTIGIYMFGLIGAIVAIPIAGAIKVLVEEFPNIREQAK